MDVFNDLQMFDLVVNICHSKPVTYSMPNGP